MAASAWSAAAFSAAAFLRPPWRPPPPATRWPGVVGGAATGEGDVRDAQPGQVGAGALLDAGARLGLVLEDDDLVAALLAQHLRRDAGAIDERASDRRGVAVGDEQDAIERDGVAGLDVQPIDLDLSAELDAVLLAAGFDDCVHGVPVG